jgi:hypothetical protein
MTEPSTPPETHDVLCDPAHTIWGVHCRVDGAALHCGALYVGPLIPFHLIRLADSCATIDVELPEELRNLSSAVRLWDVALPIVTHEQVRQPPVQA